MRITSGGTTIEYGVTAGGQFVQVISNEKGTLIKASPFGKSFLKWLLAPLQTAEKVRKDVNEAYEYPHHCHCCGEGFDKDHGVMIEGKKICNPCRDTYRYFDVFRNTGMSDRTIYYLTETQL